MGSENFRLHNASINYKNNIFEFAEFKIPLCTASAYEDNNIFRANQRNVNEDCNNESKRIKNKNSIKIIPVSVDSASKNKIEIPKNKPICSNENNGLSVCKRNLDESVCNLKNKDSSICNTNVNCKNKNPKNKSVCCNKNNGLFVCNSDINNKKEILKNNEILKNKGKSVRTVENIGLPVNKVDEDEFIGNIKSNDLSSGNINSVALSTFACNSDCSINKAETWPISANNAGVGDVKSKNQCNSEKDSRIVNKNRNENKSEVNNETEEYSNIPEISNKKAKNQSIPVKNQYSAENREIENLNNSQKTESSGIVNVVKSTENKLENRNIIEDTENWSDLNNKQFESSVSLKNCSQKSEIETSTKLSSKLYENEEIGSEYYLLNCLKNLEKILLKIVEGEPIVNYTRDITAACLTLEQALKFVESNTMGTASSVKMQIKELPKAVNNNEFPECLIKSLLENVKSFKRQLKGKMPPRAKGAVMHIRDSELYNDRTRFEKIKSMLRLDHLTPEQKTSIEKIVEEYSDRFYLEGDKLSVTNVLEHEIPTRTETSIRIK